MRYALKDYQVRAVRDVLDRLRRAARDTREYGDSVAFALSATTGAGKTVMAAAVIEALFRGSDEYEVDPDPTATVLWVTDDPALNEQTRHRFIAAADRLDLSQLVIIDEGFQQETLTPGTVFFLNIQKLRSDTNYVKTSDKRGITLWETIQNTIDSPDRTLYLVLDEAHKGMRSDTTRTREERNRSTTVQRLINGHDGMKPVPIVWGISATVDRFTEAMRAAQDEGRTTYPPVRVEPRDVQESGLLKETMILDVPGETGQFDTVFLRRAVREIRTVSQLWAAYADREQLPDPVDPLLVLQVPNTPSQADLTRYVETIRAEWPDLPDVAIANVFGEHVDLRIAGVEVPYVAPQDVQDRPHIRILLAKDAVSTGWDCPRAEVLCSFRPARDRTHITQLLGRMVRTPLARRVESDERLNTVSCFLPFFDAATVRDVAAVLTGAKTDAGDPDSASAAGTGRKVLTQPVEMRWNADVPEDVRAFMSVLPSESVPSSGGTIKPISRLLSLAAELAKDRLMMDPDRQARSRLYRFLDSQMALHAEQVASQGVAIQTADIRRLTLSLDDGTQLAMQQFGASDSRTIDEAFKVATRALGVKIANGYEKDLTTRATIDDEFDPYEARVRIAALMSLPSVRDAVDKDAEELTRQWLGEQRVTILGLREDRRAAYDALVRQDREPQPIEIVLPETRIENTRDSNNIPLPTLSKHLQSDARGNFPIGSLNDWERLVVQKETERLDCVGWYRNPSKATSDALQIPYRDGETWRSMQPDFLFFTRKQNGSLAAAIVDPHGDHLPDALSKLKGLVRFTERYGSRFLRIESVAKVGDELRFLDLQNPTVRNAIVTAKDARSLYRDESLSLPLL